MWKLTEFWVVTITVEVFKWKKNLGEIIEANGILSFSRCHPWLAGVKVLNHLVYSFLAILWTSRLENTLSYWWSRTPDQAQKPLSVEIFFPATPVPKYIFNPNSPFQAAHFQQPPTNSSFILCVMWLTESKPWMFSENGTPAKAWADREIPQP